MLFVDFIQHFNLKFFRMVFYFRILEKPRILNNFMLDNEF